MACEQMFTFQSILNFLVIKHHSCNAKLCCLLVISMGISMREANDILLLSILVVSSNFSPGTSILLQQMKCSFLEWVFWANLFQSTLCLPKYPDPWFLSSRCWWKQRIALIFFIVSYPFPASGLFYMPQSHCAASANCIATHTCQTPRPWLPDAVIHHSIMYIWELDFVCSKVPYQGFQVALFMITIVNMLTDHATFYFS